MITSWVLMVFVTIGAISDKDSMALTTAYFTDEQKCKAAGTVAVAKFGTGTKRAEYVCARQ